MFTDDITTYGYDLGMRYLMGGSLKVVMVEFLTLS